LPDSYITKKALADAMKQLMNQKPFSKINVADICSLCKMNRKSFYYHFKDKYDLVNWIYYTEFVMTIKAQPYEDGWKLMKAACEYFYENRSFYKRALEVSGQNSFCDYFRDILKPIVQGYLSEVFLDQQDASFFATFYTDAFLASIERWLKESPCRPPGEYVGLLSRSLAGFSKMILEDTDFAPPQS